MAQAAELTALRAWVEERAGGTITRWERASSGGSRETFFVDVKDSAGEVRPLVLRAEAGGSFTGTAINVVKEAAVYRALAGTAVPVPEILGLAPEGAALLMEWIDGSSDVHALDDDQRETVITSFVDVIADLHSVPVDALELPGWARPTTNEEHATLDLAVWEKLGRDGVPDMDPLIGFAGSYLRTHPPARVARTVLVQGDTGPGNFLFREGSVVALVDMEFAHLGDPMDDLAWMSMRTASTGVDVSRLFGRYSERSGIEIDSRSIDFYRIAVQYRCAITTSLAVARGGGARGWAPYLLVTQRYLIGLAAALSSYLGVAEPPTELEARPPSPRAGEYDYLMGGIRAAVRGIGEPALREETRNLQILVHHLRAYDAIGRAVEASDEADLRSTLGVAYGDARALAEAAETGGARADEAVLRYLLRRTHRNAALWHSVLERERRRS